MTLQIRADDTERLRVDQNYILPLGQRGGEDLTKQQQEQFSLELIRSRCDKGVSSSKTGWDADLVQVRCSYDAIGSGR